MGIEIEVRFLVFAPPSLEGLRPASIVQGYLSTGPESCVRIRQRDDAGFLTIKGKKTGAVAAEFEYPLPGPDIAPLLALCGPRLVQKARYKIPGPDGQVWELDLFSGQHQGLMIAELELQQEKSPYLKPDWLGPEITQDPRFSNANLSRCDRAEVSGWILEYGK